MCHNSKKPKRPGGAVCRDWPPGTDDGRPNKNSPHGAGGKEYAKMEKKLWLNAEGKVMMGNQELPRCRVLSMEASSERRFVRVAFEIEVEELDIQFQAIVLDEECGDPSNN